MGINTEEEETITHRIFVGGLGGKVTEEDIKSRFSSLGVVKGVVFVRSNGRNFSYIDFKPSSVSSISKLFSMYNGCVWKGGRLKLEKAKEHYLVRLKREWAEDVKPAKRPINEDKSVPIKEKEKLKLLTADMQLQVFFPKLRKVKPVPYNGTGKHKYSFQHIDVPSLPIHFCDCDEHYDPAKTLKKSVACKITDQTDALDEEELNMMHSVLSKFLKKNNNVPPENSNEDGNSHQSVDDFPLEDSDTEEEADEDNLVINIVNKRSRSSLAESQEWGTISTHHHEIESTKSELSNDNLIQDNFKSQKRKATTPFTDNDKLILKQKKKVKWVTLEEDSVGSLIEKAQSINEKENTLQSSVSPVKKQKTSWKKLIGEAADTSFCISHIFSDTTKGQGVLKTDCLAVEKSCHIKEDDRAMQSINSEVTANKALLCGNKAEILQQNVAELSSITVETSPPSMEEPPFTTEAPLPTTKTLSTIIPSTTMEAAPSTTKVPASIISCEEAQGSITDKKESRGESWLHKSSWRELVGEIGNTSFSISNILPGNVSASEGLPINFGVISGQPFGRCPTAVHPNDSDSAKGGILHKKAYSFAPSEQPSHATENLNHALENKKDEFRASVDETCPFMRSAASEKEWTKTKAALTRSLNKRNNPK